MTLTAEQKAQRRAARDAWTQRERARRAAARPPKEPKPAPPTPPVGPIDRTGWSDACDDGQHNQCGRVLTCRCWCHERHAE